MTHRVTHRVTHHDLPPRAPGVLPEAVLGHRPPAPRPRPADLAARLRRSHGGSLRGGRGSAAAGGCGASAGLGGAGEAVVLVKPSLGSQVMGVPPVVIQFINDL